MNTILWIIAIVNTASMLLNMWMLRLAWKHEPPGPSNAHEEPAAPDPFRDPHLGDVFEHRASGSDWAVVSITHQSEILAPTIELRRVSDLRGEVNP